MRAYLIARVSTEDQEDALPGQVYRLQEYCTRNGYDGSLFELQESAYKDGRKQFAKIIEAIEAETEKVIVVFDKIDRYSRDSGSVETSLLRKLCKAGKIEIHFPSDNLAIHSTSPAQSWFMLGMGETTAEYYSRSVSDNVRRRFEQKLRDGEWIGKAPFGYINSDKSNGKKWVEIDDAASEIVRAIFDWYATGVSSFRTIAARVRAEYGLHMTQSKVEIILKNPFYIGQMRIKDKLYPHSYATFIAESLYEAAEAVRSGYKVKPAIYAGLPYPYRGLISCADCGCRVTFEKKKAKYVYGHCTQTKGKHGASYVNEVDLTSVFAKTFESISMSEDDYTEVSEALKQSSADDVRESKEKLGRIQAEITKYDQRIERVYEDYIDDKIPEDLYNRKFEEFKAAKQVLVKRREKFELVSKDIFSSVSHLLELSRDAPKLFEKGNLERKRQLIKMVHSNLELSGKELRWKLKKPYDCMAICNLNGNWLRLLGSNQRHSR
jgi:site-specific DNA recombinase